MYQKLQLFDALTSQMFSDSLFSNCCTFSGLIYSSTDYNEPRNPILLELKVRDEGRTSAIELQLTKTPSDLALCFDYLVSSASKHTKFLLFFSSVGQGHINQNNTSDVRWWSVVVVECSLVYMMCLYQKLSTHQEIYELIFSLITCIQGFFLCLFDSLALIAIPVPFNMRIKYMCRVP